MNISMKLRNKASIYVLGSELQVGYIKECMSKKIFCANFLSELKI